MSHGHEDDQSLAEMFEMANGGIDHSDYKQTEEWSEPLHFDSTNNFQDNYGTATYDSERHSQVKKPTSRLNSNNTNEKQQHNVIRQAFESASHPNKFIEDLLKGTVFEDPAHATNSLNALIDSGEFNDDYGATLDFPGGKGSKWKTHYDEDEQDIHGGGTSNAYDDDSLGTNSPGSSQGSYAKRSSSSVSPAAPTPAHTAIVEPTSPPVHNDTHNTSPQTKDIQDLGVYHPPNDQLDDINHAELEYNPEPDYPMSTQVLPSTTYGSGITVGPVPPLPQVKLPLPIAAPPLPQTTVVVDPLHANNHYSVDKVQLSNFLKENGRQVSGRKRKSKEEIERLIKRFCDPKELDYCTESDAQDIIDSDFEVKNVPLRNRADHGKYLCKFCPITQKHKRGFERKEDMKRHYHQHLNYVRFSCKHCEYKNARTDHMKNHMRKCHPEKDAMDYNRNS